MAIADAWWERKPKIVEFVNKHLTVEGARIFTPEHTYFADHFPRWFGNGIGNCPVIEPRAYMIGNMYVEEVDDPTIHDTHHGSMVIRRGLGMTREQVLNHVPSIPMRMGVQYWDNVSRTRPYGELAARKKWESLGLDPKYPCTGKQRMPPIPAKVDMPTRRCALSPSTPRPGKKVGVCSRRCARASAFFVSSTIITLSAPSQLGKDRNRRQKIMDAIFVGTLDGVFKVARSNGDWRVASKDLPGMEVRTLRSRRFRRTRRAAMDRPMVPLLRREADQRLNARLRQTHDRESSNVLVSPGEIDLVKM